MSARSTAPQRLFVGGTGRCGTHAMGSLLGRHSRYRRIHTELRFHADPPGLPGLLRGEVELAEFLATLRGRWWKRTASQGFESGLFKRVPEEIFERAIAEFERDFPDDQWGAASRLVYGLLDPIAAQAKKPGWVEMSNRNVEASPVLLELVPDIKMIHMIRDGRDASSSVVAQKWGPDEIMAAIAWWERRVADDERSSSQLPEERLLIVCFEDFVTGDREGTYDRLLDFIGERRLFRGRREPEMRRFFDEEIGTGRANIERWRKGLSEAEQDELCERYAAALERLIAADTPARPLFERSLQALVGPVPAPA